MKYTTALVFLAQALLHGVSSHPLEKQSQSFLPEALGEYSLQELNDIFDAQESGVAHDSKSQILRTAVSNTDSVTESIESSLVGGINMKQNAVLDYSAKCAGEEISDTFSFQVFYNGRVVTFKRTGNIDAWGKVKLGPIRPHRPIFAEVPFHHVLCKPISRQSVCTYYFSGMAQALIVSYGNPQYQGITPNAAQPYPGGDAAYVTRTCSSVTGANGKIACPAPTGPRCDLRVIHIGLSIADGA